MTVLRDIMAEAAATDRRKGATDAGGTERGVGVLGVGAEPFRHTVQRSIERGHRWVLIEEIGAVAPALVPEIYLRWFPRWKEHVDQIGPAKWQQYVDAVVTAGQLTPIGLLVRHSQLYLEAIRGAGPKIHRTQVPFSAPHFERLWNGLDEGRAA
jgi:hypothetical protein